MLIKIRLYRKSEQLNAVIIPIESIFAYAPGGNRTHNLGLRSALLCPFELLGQRKKIILLFAEIGELFFGGVLWLSQSACA
jgi:hypothetical protein